MIPPALFNASSERESLIAAWQALGNTQPLCEEAQTLCLNFMRMNGFNGPSRDSTNDQAEQPATSASKSSHESALLLPPQRYVRRAHSGNRAPPMGPSKPTEVTDVLEPSEKGWTNVAPDGPTDGHQSAICEGMDEVSLDGNA